MDLDIISEFEKIITENDWVKEREGFIGDRRAEGTHAEDNKKEKLSKEEDEPLEKEEDEEDSEEVETPDESPSTIDLADAKDFDKLKDNLNQFRASHSLSDTEVSDELQKYFDRLSSEEKRILHVFIKGLTQVTLLDVSGKTAYVPSDLKFNVTKGGAATSEKLKSKARAQKLKNKKDVEDATNTPIVIGNESIQEKTNIMRIVKENA
jgi:hypothetical protein